MSGIGVVVAVDEVEREPGEVRVIGTGLNQEHRTARVFGGAGGDDSPG